MSCHCEATAAREPPSPVDGDPCRLGNHRADPRQQVPKRVIGQVFLAKLDGTADHVEERIPVHVEEDPLRADDAAVEAIEEAADETSALIRLAAVRAGARDIERLLDDPVGAVAVNAAQTANRTSTARRGNVTIASASVCSSPESSSSGSSTAASRATSSSNR